MSSSSRRWVLVLIGIIVVSVLVGGLVFDPENPPAAPATPTPLQIESVDLARTADAMNLSTRLVNPDQGSQAGFVSLQVDADGDGTYETTVERRQVRLGGGERLLVSFAQSTAELDSGDHDYRVLLTDPEDNALDERAVTVTVRDPPAFQVAGVPGRTVAVRGEAPTVTFEVTNVGDLAGRRPVALRVDADGDGAFESGETLDSEVVELGPGETRAVALRLPTRDIEPGTYALVVATPADSMRGTLTVERPATFEVEFGDHPSAITRGDPLNTTVTVTNHGAVRGNTTLVVGAANGTEQVVETVVLDGGASTTLDVGLETGNLSRGDTEFVAAVDGTDNSTTVYVRAPQFDVTRVTDTVGGRNGVDYWVEVEADVENTGDVPGTETVRLQIDLDGDGVPERVGLDRSVSLDVGARATLRFEIPTEMAGSDADVELPVGTHVYGVYSDDSAMTNDVTVRDDGDHWWESYSRTDGSVSDGPTSGGSDDGGSQSGGSDDGGSQSGGSDDGGSTGGLTLDDIARAKYGLSFERLSDETKGQVREIQARQPFADGLTVDDVSTREEFARRVYGVDIRGQSFDFTALSLDLQQRIEADYDAQFTSDAGDSVESWDEIANAEYGVDYDSLSTSEQDRVRTLYDAQFA